MFGRHAPSALATMTLGRRAQEPAPGRKLRRIDSLQLGARLHDGALADLLPDNIQVSRHAKQHLPAALDPEGAHGHIGSPRAPMVTLNPAVPASPAA